MRETPVGFEELDILDQIRYLQELWDRIAAHPDRVPLTDAQRAELERRRAAAAAGPGAAVPWDTVKRQLRASR